MPATDRLAEPAVPGPLTPGPLAEGEIRRTAEFIASQQWPDGGIPWFTGSHLDPWDHVESAMALSAAGLRDAAERAYAYCRATQRDDGTWPMVVRQGFVEDAAADTNQCAYVAVGVWHHYLVTRDTSFLAELWPTVRRAIDFAVGAQRPGGELAWAVNAFGVPEDYALVTGSSSAVQALRCATAIAAELGARPLRWRTATDRLAHAVRAHPERFADRSRYSMDWYYPVLAGAVRGPAAERHLAAGWRTFVRPGQGVRCVSDRPWFTVAESCELALALDAVGDAERASRVFADVQHLRDADGAYWTGFVPEDDAIWPRERTTWTAAAVVLAADALGRTSGGSGVFRDAGRPGGADPVDCECGGGTARSGS